MRLPSYLFRSRHGIYYLRIRRGGRSRSRSLGTRDPRLAVAMAWQFGAKIASMSMSRDPNDPAYLAELLSGSVPTSRFSISINGDNIQIATDGTQQDADNSQRALVALLAARTQAPQQHSASLSNPCTLGDAVRDYLEERKPDWTHSTFTDYSGTLHRLASGLGETTPLHKITKDQYVKWRAKWLDSLHPKSQEKASGAIRGFERWAVERGRLAEHFVVKQQLTRAVANRLRSERGRDQRPLDATDLDKVLSPEVIQGARRPDLFFLPILGLYTGARLGELAQLRICDIQRDNHGLVITITGAAGQVKTSVSERCIPLHAALEVPLMAYLDDLRRAWPDAERLFPHLVPDSRNGYANRPGQDLSTAWKKRGLGEGKSFHSLRHNFITALATARVDPDLARAYTGHSVGRDDVHDKIYNHAAPRMDEYRDMLEKLDFIKCRGWSPPNYVYTPHQYDDFFAKAQRRISVRAARQGRAARANVRRKR